MKRKNILALLNEYDPKSKEEIEHKLGIIDFVNKHEQCFERSLAIGHITASAWLENKNGSKALLMHHVKLNKWLQLGGHCDGDSDVFSVALKEAREESGIMNIEIKFPKIFDVDIHLIPANNKEIEHYHYDVRLHLRVTSEETPIKNKEAKELRWVSQTLADLPTNELSIIRMFAKWRALK